MTEQKRNHHIIGLKVRNIKRLTAIDFVPNPDDAIIGIGGKNASGKTSLLDSIMYSLGGGKHIGEDPVRHGAKKGEVEVELDDYIVKRVITKKGATLTIKGKDGKNYASPQTLLDEMTGKLTFDPLRFQRLSETPAGRREQAEMLRELVGLNFAAQDNSRKNLFDRRGNINRDLKRVTAQLESLPFYSGIPNKEISVAHLSKKLQEAVRQNEQNIRERNVLTTQQQHIKETEEGIERLQKELAKRRALLIQQQGKVEELKDVDEAELREQIEKAEEMNGKIRKNLSRNSLLTEQSDSQKQADDLTAQMQKIDEQKAKVLSEAEMPVDGLEFTDESVTFQNVPFEDCSSAEQLKLSVAMGISMNPRLRIMLIRDGSLLDEDSRKTLKEMATAADMQVWVEYVGTDEQCAVVIEDGMIAETK